MKNVTVIDYGMGNLFSVTQAFEQLGVRVEVASDSEAIARAESLILPGVGAFADGMEGLRKLDLIPAIQEYAASGRPLLGICLGMQMLLGVSEEFGLHTGLGIVPGRVVAIPAVNAEGRHHKIPHIGWNAIIPPPRRPFLRSSALKDIPEGTAFYFVHTYAVVPERDEHRLADCYYDSFRISAVIGSGAVLGCQFHPEKSGKAGLVFLRQFLQRESATGVLAAVDASPPRGQ